MVWVVMAFLLSFVSGETHNSFWGLSFVTRVVVLHSGHKNLTELHTFPFLNSHSYISLCNMKEVYFQGM